MRMLPGTGVVRLGIDGERNEVIGAGDRDGAFGFYFLCFYEDLGGGGVRKVGMSYDFLVVLVTFLFCSGCYARVLVV